MKKALIVSIMLLAAFIISGCEQKGKSGGPVLAKVGSSEITQDDFIKEADRIPDWAKSQFSGKEGKERFLDELVKRELIYQDAKKMGLDKDKEYLEKLKEFERMSLVALILKKEIEDKAKVDDADVKNFYDKNKSQLTLDNKARASHILVDTEDQAKKLYDRIKKGESFSKLAEQYSKDKNSAVKGGDLGYFDPAKMVPEFSRALVNLKPGDVSEPVRTRFGYHIIQLTDVQRGNIATFDQTKETIKRQLLAEKQKSLVDAYLDGLRKKIEVKKNESTLASITLPWEKADKK